MAALSCGHEHGLDEECPAYLGEEVDDDGHSAPVYGYGRHVSGYTKSGLPTHSYKFILDQCPLPHLARLAPVMYHGRSHAGDPRMFNVRRSSHDMVELVLAASLMHRAGRY